MAHRTHVSTPSPVSKPRASRFAKLTETDSNSLPEAFATVHLPSGDASWLGRFLVFVGPGYMVSVGYMDPGNWATDLQGGAQSGYTLLSVIMLSNLMAILLQGLSARLDIATGRDLAQACRDHFPPAINIMLWLACELASIACDLAAVIGTAVALQLLFGIPLLAGAVISVLDTIIVLFLMNRGFRYLEAFIIGLLSIIAICFAVQVVAVAPPLAGIVKGFLPLPEIVTNSQMLYIASCCCSAKSSCRCNCPSPSFLWFCSSPTAEKWASSSFPRSSPRSVDRGGCHSGSQLETAFRHDFLGSTALGAPFTEEPYLHAHLEI